MRVFESNEGTKVALHMGSCQPKHATGYFAELVSWAHTSLLMPALNSSIRLLVNCAMALHKLCILAASSYPSVVFWIDVFWVTQCYSITVPESVPVSGTRVFCRHRALAQRAYNFVGYSPPCFCSLVNPLYIAIPRERPRMGCKRGGSRGRATSQRSAPISPSSSDELEPERSGPPVTKAGRGRGRGRGRMAECEHATHPTVRYRIPCTLANSTFIVSVTIEKCEDLRGHAVAHPEIPAEQRMAPPIDSQRPVMGSSSMANQVVPAGPSEQARGEPTGSVVLHSDLEDSLQYGCRVVEEPYATDDD